MLLTLLPVNAFAEVEDPGMEENRNSEVFTIEAAPESYESTAGAEASEDETERTEESFDFEALLPVPEEVENTEALTEAIAEEQAAEEAFPELMADSNADAVGSARAGAGIELEDVSVYLTVPHAGEEPDYTPYYAINANFHPAPDNNDTTQNGVFWYDKTTGTYLEVGKSTFIAEHDYEVTVDLEPDDGYYFSNRTSGAINDNSVSTEVEYLKYVGQLRLRIVFHCDNPISFVSIHITPPAVGAEPTYNPSFDGPYYSRGTEGVTRDGVYWMDNGLEYMEFTDKFLCGHRYSVHVYLTAEDGYELQDGFTAAINGNPAVVSYSEASYMFPAMLYSDVSDPSAYYYDAVYWAAGQGITSGTSPTTFSPGRECTRGQIVTFLWKAMGSPYPFLDNNPFTDVKSTDYFYQAVLWAKKNGITSGTSETTFSPGKPCTRGQIVTFLWKALGSPEPGSLNNPFTDVKSTDYFFKAVLWAKENGITSGTGATTFSPGKTCTRAQAMTFLWNAFN